MAILAFIFLNLGNWTNNYQNVEFKDQIALKASFILILDSG